MRTLIKLFLFIGLLIFGSCIKNDLPYPVIKGEILEIAVANMIESKIDAETRRATIKVTDDTKLDSIYITKFVITEGAKFVIDPLVYLDFTSFPDTGFVSIDSLPDTMTPCINANGAFDASINIYQDYSWKISIERDINRIIKVKNQTGSLVDVHNKTVVIYVDPLLQPEFHNIEIEQLQLGSSIAVTTPDPTTVTSFRRPEKFEVTAFGETEYWTVTVMHPSDNAFPTEVSVWSRRAYVRGSTETGQVDIQFRIQKDTIWDAVLPSEITFDDKGIFTAVMTHLRPVTTYDYIVSIDGAVEELSTFTTVPSEIVPNLSFDDWYLDGKVWYASETDAIFWDSGNPGGAPITGNNPTMPEPSNVVKGQAAALKSTAVMGIFAAGNLYTGKFFETVGMEGAKIDFGQPFTGRPSALKGYYHYKPGIIDIAGGDYAHLKDKTDSCHMYIALFDESYLPFRVNSVEKIFVDLTKENKNLIAFGEIKTDKSTDGAYKPFRINLEYSNYFVKPTHILIVASASKYGDYMTGSTTSELYLDEFELVYD